MLWEGGGMTLVDEGGRNRRKIVSATLYPPRAPCGLENYLHTAENNRNMHSGLVLGRSLR